MQNGQNQSQSKYDQSDPVMQPGRVCVRRRIDDSGPELMIDQSELRPKPTGCVRWDPTFRPANGCVSRSLLHAGETAKILLHRIETFREIRSSGCQVDNRLG